MCRCRQWVSCVVPMCATCGTELQADDIHIHIEKHIISKKKYNENIYIQSHPYYMIAGILSLHPNYIMEILLNEESEVEKDVELIMKIDKYTKENDKRNYDKNLLKTFY